MANYILPSVLNKSVGRDGFAVVLSNGTGNVYILKEIPRELTGSIKEIETYLADKKIMPKLILEAKEDDTIVGVRPISGNSVSGKLIDVATSIFNKYSVATLREGNFINSEQAVLVLARTIKKGRTDLSVDECKAEAEIQFSHLQLNESMEALASIGFKPSARLSKALLDKAKETVAPPVVESDSDESDDSETDEQ